MKFVQAISEIMDSIGMSKAELSRKRRVTPQTINSMFSEKRRLSLDVASETARAMDYRIVLMPCAAKLPAKSFEIDG